MSNSTTSPNFLRPASKASVPPIWPAPISAILLRAMGKSSSRKARGVLARKPERGKVDAPALIGDDQPHAAAANRTARHRRRAIWRRTVLLHAIGRPRRRGHQDREPGRWRRHGAARRAVISDPGI